MTKTEKNEITLKAKHTYIYLLVLSIFSAACFFAAFFLNLNASSNPLLKTSLPPSGGEAGPFEVKSKNSVITITVSGDLSVSYGNTWSFVEGELLDADKEFLMGFGDEMWKERDAEGTYQNTEYELTVTIAGEGLYYLKFTPEYESIQSAGPIYIKVTQVKGNSHVHFILGLIALGIIFYFYWKTNQNYMPGYYGNKSSGKKSSNKKSTQKNSIKNLQIIIWIGLFLLFVWLETQC